MARVKVKQLVPGSDGQVLKTVSGVPTWAAESSGGVAAVGSPSITKMEPISLSGPASYAAGGFTATFTNLTTLQRAIICLVSGTFYLFKVTAKSANQATIRAFRALNSHTHTFTPTAHTHTLTMNAHTHTFTGTTHTHSLTMTAHSHGITVVAGSGGLAVSCSTTQFLVPIGNPSRTINTNTTTSTGTVGSTVAAGTNANTTSTGTIASASATGTNSSTLAEALEEVANGTNLSGVTLELLGFGS
jgi:hypothetical protein